MKVIHRPDEVFGKLFSAQAPRSGIFYVPSQFSLPFSYRGKQYVFHTLTKQFIEAVLPAYTVAGEKNDDLIRARFLVPEDKNEYSEYCSMLKLLNIYERKNTRPTYIILPTLGCNARCAYCFQEGMKPQGMTAETVDDTLRFILNESYGKKITFRWFGGEPLLREDVIDRISRGVKDAGIDYKSLMVTNGSLITPETIEKMTGLWRLERIQISMDGAEQDYIARKRYLHYCDDYRRVIEAIDRMSEAGISVQIRSNVDENNIDGIPQFLNDLAAGIAHKKTVSVYLSPLYEAMQGTNALKLWTKILSLRRTITEAGFIVQLDNMNTLFSTQRCIADGGGIVIAPDGTMYCCEHLPDDSRIGDVKNGIAVISTREDFIGTDRRPEKCRTCVFLPDCMPISGCPNYGYICRDAHRLFLMDALHRMINEAERTESKNKEKV